MKSELFLQKHDEINIAPEIFNQKLPDIVENATGKRGPKKDSKLRRKAMRSEFKKNKKDRKIKYPPLWKK